MPGRCSYAQRRAVCAESLRRSSQRFTCADQLLQCDGLGEIIVCAQYKGTLPFVCRRHQDDLQLWPALLSTISESDRFCDQRKCPLAVDDQRKRPPKWAVR